MIKLKIFKEIENEEEKNTLIRGLGTEGSRRSLSSRSDVS